MKKKRFKLYVFVLVPQLISDKSTAKGKLTGECILYWIRMSCKAIDFSCSYTGGTKKKRKIRRNGWILKYKKTLLAVFNLYAFDGHVYKCLFSFCNTKSNIYFFLHVAGSINNSQSSNWNIKTLPMYRWSNFIWVIQCWDISTVYFL